MALDDEDLEKIGGMLTGALADHIPREEHKTHHDYIRRKIDNDMRREQLIEKVKSNIISWGITASIAGALAMIWYALTHGFASK